MVAVRRKFWLLASASSIGWRTRGAGVAADVFVPFGFEVGGALGERAEGLMAECVQVAEWKNQGVGDLAFWSSMTWGGHWRERIGVEIARGVARCVAKAATGGWGGVAPRQAAANTNSIGTAADGLHVR